MYKTAVSLYHRGYIGSSYHTPIQIFFKSGEGVTIFVVGRK